MPNEHAGQPGEGNFPGQTYLFIRTNPGDDGNEPLQPGLKHWKSPDIAVVQPNGARGTAAVAGQNNQVEVTVHNAGGLDATDAWVDAFHTDPSTGISPATASLVGAGNLSVPTAASRAIAFPWQPATADAGHRCLIARVALYFPFDAYVDGSKFQVRKDRHVAQRNISVIQMGGDTNVTFAFAMVNPRNRATTMSLRPKELRKAGELNRIRACLGCGLAQFGETRLPNVKVDLAAESVQVPRSAKLGDARMTDRLPDLGQLAAMDLHDPRSRFKVRMKAREVRRALISIERNPATRKGDIHAVDIVQRTDRQTLIGGLTVVLVH